MAQGVKGTGFGSDKRARKLSTLYGMTVAEYDALLAQQTGVCAICFQPPTGRRLAVDHDHATGKVRGLLCTACNVGLGNFQDDPNLLRQAVRYLA